MKKIDILKGSISKNLILLSLPMMGAFLLQNLFNIVDTFFVAKLGAYAIAAVSMAFPVIFFMIALAQGIGTGVSSLVARSIGAGKKKKIGLIATQGFILGAILTVVFTIFGISLINPLFTFMGATPEILEFIRQYMVVLYLGTAFTVFGIIANSILQGEGDTKTVMKGLVIATILNILLDPILIFGFWIIPEYGVMGAAIATVISRLAGTVYIMKHLLGGNSIAKISFGKLTWDSKIIKEILRVGVPASMVQVILSVGFFFINKIVALFGPLALAAFGLAARVDFLALLPAFSIAIANIAMVGQNIGAGQIKRAKKSAWIASVIVFVFLEIAGLILTLFPRVWFRIFTTDSVIIDLGAPYLRIMGLSMGFIGLTIVSSSSFQASGRPLPSVVIVGMRVIFLALPLSYLLAVPFGLDTVGIWIGLAVANVIGGIVAPIWFQLSKKFVKA